MTGDTTLIFSLMTLMVFIGGVGGFLSGLLGVGGGFLFVPALAYGMTALGYSADYSMHLAIGTSLAIMVANGAVSVKNHQKHGGVDIDLLKDWGPFVVLGVVLGSGVASSLKSETLTILFVTITFLMSLYMGFSQDSFARAQKSEKKAETYHPFFFFFMGLLSSLVGIGGAIMTVPFMTWSGMPIARAIGTAAAFGLLISIPGTIGYIIMGAHASGLPPLSLGFVNLPATVLIIPSAILMSPYGVRMAHSLQKDTLRKVFAFLLLLISLKMFYGLIHHG